MIRVTRMLIISLLIMIANFIALNNCLLLQNIAKKNTNWQINFNYNNIKIIHEKGII